METPIATPLCITSLPGHSRPYMSVFIQELGTAGYLWGLRSMVVQVYWQQIYLLHISNVYNTGGEGRFNSDCSYNSDRKENIRAVIAISSLWRLECWCIKRLCSLPCHGLTRFFTIVYSAAAPCNKPLGLQNRRIPDSRITASSEWNHFHAARFGRLGQVKHGRFVGAWCARHNNHLQWFKVDFGRPMKITKVATQGRQDTNQWVKSFYLSSSQDNVHWEMYKFRSAYKVMMIKKLFDT